MDGADRPSDLDPAFARLREVLAAPDRRGWRRFLRRRREAHLDAVVADGADVFDRASRQRPRLAALAALPLLGAAAVLLVSIARPPTPSRPSAAFPPTPEVEIEVADPDSEPGPVSVPLPHQVWPGEDVIVEESGEVRVGRQRWAVGTAGDVVVIGDWDCDRQTTPAVLRPASGALYVFDGWAALGSPAVARKVADVPGAIEATAVGCGTAMVRTSDGTERSISTEVLR